MDDDDHQSPTSNLHPPILPLFTNIDRGSCGLGFVANRYGKPDHQLLQLGIQSLTNLQHRGALNADGVTGDGAGILTSLPKPFFAREAQRLTNKPVDPDRIAVATLFVHPETLDDCRAIFEVALAASGLHLTAWRNVPHDASELGDYARETQPLIIQAIIACPDLPAEKIERRLFLTRKRFDRDARGLALAAYVVSCSSQTIVYKGLLLAPQLSTFYADLRDPAYAPHLVIFHQRYSTNTLPSWHRAQPFRVLCHNGEINTIQGNIAWMASREANLKYDSPDFHLRADDLAPVIDLDGSDTAMLDNAAELLTRGGRDIRHAMAMLMPTAWEKDSGMPPHVRDFYRYHAALMEPWDGPAAIVFSDGRIIGACLDRNGLRPFRYFICKDGTIGAASEVGAIPMRAIKMTHKERLGPGQMFAVDTQTGELLHNAELKERLASGQPYGDWLKENLRPVTNRSWPLASNHLTTQLPNHLTTQLPNHLTTQQPNNLTTQQPNHLTTQQPNHLTTQQPNNLTTQLPNHLTTQQPNHLTTQQSAFGYTTEELVVIIKPMIHNRSEAIGSMGDDTPAAILSPKPRPLFSYFRQRFAEVTNPPIDYIREPHVMSLKIRLGTRPNLLEETPKHARVIELESPLLADATLDFLRDDSSLRPTTLSTLVAVTVCARPNGLAHALKLLCARAEAAARSGSRLIILSDVGVDNDHTFIPSLLAASAVHHHLLRDGLRGRVSLVVESGEPRDVHHFATLISYGANAINPYLALATALSMAEHNLSPARAMRNYLHAAEHGLFKIMAKMGITTIDSYCGAQIFEAVGVSNAIIAQHFEGTPSHLGGLDLGDIAKIVLSWHTKAFSDENSPKLESHGFYKFKRDGETHGFSPDVVNALHEAVEHNDYELYKKFVTLVHSRPPIDFRDLLDFALPTSNFQLPVESISAIVKRFSTAAMSHGALSKEAHEIMSTAMNRIGAWSNSGEGGEDPARYDNEKNDRIKQVASARFGVTPDYLISADELQIKMAQGAKPGEGGQLPSNKVTAEIAAMRHAQPGMILISPPPHHDIYSIEDLAQLIYDLRQINPRADISVKLVAQAGVGTIAAGVAKAGADIILISGHNGGTGASPQSSIKYAGVAWELGLADAQHALVNSGLRSRVRLRIDGGLRTGRDVLIAALMGADEFSFGTVAAVAVGCVMARACHLNTCPAGIATQDPKLRAKFKTPPDHLISYMNFVAAEVRELLTQLGLNSMQEAIGRVDLLKQVKEGLEGNPPIDLWRLITPPDGEGARRYTGTPNPLKTTAPLNQTLLNEAMSAIETGDRVELKYSITNQSRAFGASVANEITRRRGRGGVPLNTILIRTRGSAGQSYGAFSLKGMHFKLIGEANDYVGKGLSGGEISIAPSPDYHGEQPVIAGNAILYGATSGAVFIAGRVGERFAVRNSGAVAVVEGVGDHGCEYMTGGVVVVLGSVGRNFGAGMSGGKAYIMINDQRLNDHSLIINLESLINTTMVTTDSLNDEDVETLRELIARHVKLTRSARGKKVLANFDPAHFIKVMPRQEPLDTTPKGEPVPIATPAVV